jgi:2-desacetyl-2-hydroxyethyl bacteriochlorophyllide A dehydrogenase
MKVKAIVFEKENVVGVGEFTMPEMQDDHILIKALYTFVSSGTELRVLSGHYGAAGNFPLIPGYAIVGEVLDFGKDVKGYKVGDLVSTGPDASVKSKPLGINAQWGGQASHHLIPMGYKPVLLPQGCNPFDYIISQVSAISWRGVEAAQPKQFESAVVIGQGTIGAFSTAWLISKGCRVITVDVADYRLERSLKYGAYATVNAADENVVERIMELTNGGADIVVECSGVMSGVQLAHKIVHKTPASFGTSMSTVKGNWPRIVYQANYLEQINLDPWTDINSEGVVVITPMDRSTEDRQNVIESIRRGLINPMNFIDLVVPYTDAPAAYEKLSLLPDKVFSVVFDWTK